MRAALIALSSFALALSTSQLAAQEAGESSVAGQKVDFAKQIAPIFVARCIECHGAEKDKGDLRLDSRAVAFPEGDEDYWTILAGKPEDSELLRRVTLPDGDDEIMPEKGEPLSKAEQALIRQWIAEGAEWGESGDAAIAGALKAMEVPKITFELPALGEGQGDAIQTAMQQLKKLGAVVQRVAADTEAIDVNLSLLRAKVTDRELAWLEPLAPRLVWLNLSRTAITDAGAKSLRKLTQLRRLHVANTALTDAAVKQLDGLNQLEFANFYGTKITDDALPFFLLLPKLQKLHAWQTGVSPERAKAARDNFASFHVDVGDYAEARMAAAQKEIAEREAEKKAKEEAAKKAAAESGAPVNDKCPVTGGKVDAAQVVEHDGQKIGFCCAKCKAKFEKNPKKYAAKLPKKK